jgi:phenylalanyl-tRNA synthetase alpha chain
MLTSYVRHFPIPTSRETHSMLYSGAWKSAHFKKYNFESEGIYPNGGALHPLLKVREEMRNIFLEMGLVATDSSACGLSDFAISHRQLC